MEHTGALASSQLHVKVVGQGVERLTWTCRERKEKGGGQRGGGMSGGWLHVHTAQGRGRIHTCFFSLRAPYCHNVIRPLLA